MKTPYRRPYSNTHIEYAQRILNKLVAFNSFMRNTSDFSLVFVCKNMSDLPSTFVKGFHDEAAVRRMAYNKLGKTNLMVSKLSIGGGTLAPFYG